MNSLLARFASNAYWMGRYIERAENLARILRVNQTFARDRSGASDWTKIPALFSDAERYSETHSEVDEQSVLDFYVLDTDNPTSIKSSIRAARENARSIRHLISTEMWTHLNMFHNECRRLNKRAISSNKVSKVCDWIVSDCQSFEGIAEGTFLRGECWTFYQLGKLVERADQTTRVLDMGYTQLALDAGDAVASSYWSSLLRSLSAYHAYRSRHPGASTPEDIVQFLLYDDECPRAVSLCIHQMTQRIRDIERRHGVRRREGVETARRDLEFTLETGLELKLTPTRLHRFLDKLQVELGGVSKALADTYFQ